MSILDLSPEQTSSQESIAHMLRDDAREKAKAIPKPRAVGQANPRRIYFPSDLIDKRTDAQYRSGPVTSRQLDQKERILLSVGGKLPTWDDLLFMTKDEQFGILQPMVEQGLKDREIAEMFGPEVSIKDVVNRRQALGIKKFILQDGRRVPVSSGSMPAPTPARRVRTRTKPKAQDKEATQAQTNPQTQPGPLPPYQQPPSFEDDVRMRFSVGGKYEADQLASRLMSVASLLSDESFTKSGYLYEVRIHIVETNDRATKQEEKAKQEQEQKPAANGALSEVHIAHEQAAASQL